MLKIRAKAAFAALLSAVLFLSACQTETAKEALIADGLIVPEQVNYTTTQVRRGDYIGTVQGEGNVIYPYYAYLSWDTDNARIAEKHVSVGSRVSKGDVLVTMDIEVDTATVEELNLQLRRANQNLTQGKETRQTAIQNAKNEAAALTGSERTVADLKVEKLQVEHDRFVYQTQREISQIQKNIAEIQSEISNNTIVAPFDGVIESVSSYKVQDKVNAGDTIITMYSAEQYYIAVTDSPNRLKYNAPVTVEAGPTNSRVSYEGRVVAAPNIVSDDISMNYALIELDEEVDPETLRLYLSYSSVNQDIRDILLVDRTVVHDEDGKRYVYVLEDGMPKKRFVSQGSTNNSDTMILDGLTEGQEIIKD